MAVLLLVIFFIAALWLWIWTRQANQTVEGDGALVHVVSDPAGGETDDDPVLLATEEIVVG